MEACGIELAVDDNSDITDLRAGTLAPVAWVKVPPRGQKRLREKAKKMLTEMAVTNMTVERLLERDQEGEVAGWLKAIARLVEL